LVTAREGQVPEIKRIEPDDPALTVKLEARPPVVRNMSNGDPIHGEWDLDLLERTLFEFRSAGAWDGAKVEMGYRKDISCEVLAHRGSDAMPWGWRPSQGPPPPERPEPLPNPVVPGTVPGWLPLIEDLLGSRVLHGALLLIILGAVLLR
jgi:hypothetical protein